MRLGQLARKLAIRPDQITEFLAKKNIRIEEGSNTRLEDAHVALVVEKFAPGSLSIIQSESSAPESITETIAHQESVVHETIESKTEVLPIESPNQEASVNEDANEEKTEVIKAPKVELSGLKVLGKIDLPEPKKKEQSAIQTSPSTEGEPGKEIRQRERKQPLQNRNSKSNSRPAQNPIALQREREEMEAQKRREASRELEKEKRAQHYFNKVKVVTPIKPAKREQIVEEEAEPVPQPKTLLGRFFRWFRS